MFLITEIQIPLKSVIYWCKISRYRLSSSNQAVSCDQ